jgi:hypothetical protein
MATTTNYGWTTPDDTDLVKDGAAAIRTLGSSIDTTTKNLNPETTTGDIAYRSATANVNTRLGLGTAGQVLRVNSGATAPEWATTADQTPLTTKGDLFGFDTADARIPIGTNGHVLTADSTQTLGLKWAAPAGGATFVGCSVYKDTTAQSLANNTDTVITFNAEEFDTDAFHDNSVNNSRITIPAGKGGKYLILASITFAANASGIREMLFSVNGSTAVLAFAQAPSPTGSFRSSASCIKDLTAGDYVEVQAAQASGGNLNVNAGVTQTRFGVIYLGA